MFGLKKLMITATLLCAFGFSGNIEAKPDKFDSIVKEASKAYAAKNYEKAMSKYREAYDMKAMPPLLYNMGRSAESMADFSTAIDYYTKFVSSPDIEHEDRLDALDRIKACQDVLALQQGNKLPTSSPTAAAPVLAEKAPSKARAEKPSIPPGSCIDINTADLNTLTSLRKIGEAKAKQIIELRNVKGRFNDPADLTAVKGIGPKTVDGFRDQVCPIQSAQNNAKGAVAAQDSHTNL